MPEPTTSSGQKPALKITPAHTQVSRSVYKHAVFVLGQEIALVFTDLDPNPSRRMASRMKECTDKSVQEPEHRY
ncbi:MAG: UPF0058 family protein [Methanoregula sp.]|nr:UPF0058 family protein [Methanoregula sp.]